MSDLAHRPRTTVRAALDGPDPLLTTALAHSGDRVTVSVRGEMDLATTPRFQREVLALFALPIERVTVDLGALRFVDSSGVSGLLRIRRVAEEHGVRLELVAVPAQARRILELTGVAELFDIVDGPPPRAAGFD